MHLASNSVVLSETRFHSEIQMVFSASEWICKTCHTHLLHNNVPPISVYFKLISWPLSDGSWMYYFCWIYYYLCNQCLSPLMLWNRILIKARYTTLCDRACLWLATGRWFCPGPPQIKLTVTISLKYCWK